MQIGTTPQYQDPSSELDMLRNQLGQSTVGWMRKIAIQSQEAQQNYKKDKQYLQKSVWYAENHLKACQEMQQPNMVKWIKKDNKQLIGYLSPTYFDKIPENHPTLKYKTWHFLAKSDALPSAALKATLAGLSIIECGMACEISRYGALLDLFGEEKFNRLFGDKFGQRMNIGFDEDEMQPMRYFVDFTEPVFKQVVGELGNRPVKEGQIVGFLGVKDFHKKNIFACWGAANAICSDATPGRQKFITMGTGPDGMTEKEINGLLVEKYNQLTDEDFSLLAPENDPVLAMMHLLNIKQVYPIATKAEGYLEATPHDFIVEVISDVIKLPLEKVSIDFVKNHPKNIDRFKDK